MQFPRIPFDEAISEPLLLKKWFNTLSKPQQVGLKALYGIDLTEAERYYWSIFQESCTYDSLGYPTQVTLIPYIPREYFQMVGVVGRRSGKTAAWIATILVYEALLGGHTEYVGSDQECVVYQIAHRMDVAKMNMPFVKQVLESSQLLSKSVIHYGAEKYELKNRISIIPSPPSIKAQRGLAVPCFAADESGFWYTDPDSANPDVEVERALAYAQLQFPHAKRIWASTPWTREGVLWKYYNAGTEGRKLPPNSDKTEFSDVLVLHSTTAAMENPRITRRALEREKLRDSDAFERESMARFVDSISGFLSSSLLQKAIDVGCSDRPVYKPHGDSLKADSIPRYVAAMDPAFRNDSFAFTIVHKELDKGVVQDVVLRFTPVKGIKLNPSEVLDTILPYIQAYHIPVVFSDQYQLETLQELALQRGFSIQGVDFTGKSKAKIMGNLQQLVNQQKLHLLDPAVNLAAKEQLYELQILERRLGLGGAVLISAPQGKHDDMATCLALAAYQAVWMLPDTKPERPKDPTHFDLVIDAWKKKQTNQRGGDWYYD